MGRARRDMVPGRTRTPLVLLALVALALAACGASVDDLREQQLELSREIEHLDRKIAAWKRPNGRQLFDPAFSPSKLEEYAERMLSGFDLEREVIAPERAQSGKSLMEWHRIRGDEVTEPSIAEWAKIDTELAIYRAHVHRLGERIVAGRSLAAAERELAEREEERGGGAGVALWVLLAALALVAGAEVVGRRKGRHASRNLARGDSLAAHRGSGPSTDRYARRGPPAAEREPGSERQARAASPASRRGVIRSDAPGQTSRLPVRLAALVFAIVCGIGGILIIIENISEHTADAENPPALRPRVPVARQPATDAAQDEDGADDEAQREPLANPPSLSVRRPDRRVPATSTAAVAGPTETGVRDVPSPVTRPKYEDMGTRSRGEPSVAAVPPSVRPPPARVPTWARPSARQKAEAARLGVRVAFEDAVGIRFLLVPAGTFSMGSATGAAREGPVHQVVITQPFYMSQTEITQRQWMRVMRTRPSLFRGESLPVERVSWHDCIAFTKAAAAVPGCRRMTLPTEAQWEYACRAGSTTAYGFGDRPGDLGAYAWFKENASGRTHSVGSKLPNPWGFHDMHGNVWEWCLDAPRTYSGRQATDPRGLDGASSIRAYRGGSWYFSAGSERSAHRQQDRARAAYDSLGFRVVCGVERPDQVAPRDAK